MRVLIIWLTFVSMLIDNILATPLLEDGVAARTFGPQSMRRGTVSALKQIIIDDAVVFEPISQSIDYTIRAFSLKVCQLRIEFKTFILPQPSGGPNVNCVTDRLRINGFQFDLCGTLLYQHIYVPFDVTRLIDNKVLSFSISANQIAIWDIEINQIECNHKAPLVTPDVRQAPEGCLQYFHLAGGRVESFNYPLSYYGNTRYAICFNRQNFDNALLELSSITFNMDGVEPTGGDGFDGECLSGVADDPQDYIAIPFATVTGVEQPHSLFCINSLNSKTLQFRGTGPIVIHVNTDRLFEENGRETGFSFMYRIMNSI